MDTEKTKTLRHLIKCIPRTPGYNLAGSWTPNIVLSNGAKFLMERIPTSHWLLTLLNGEPVQELFKHYAETGDGLGILVINDSESGSGSVIELAVRTDMPNQVEVIWSKVLYERESKWPKGQWDLIMTAAATDPERPNTPTHAVIYLPSEMEKQRH